ncbi:MAG: hypothetical protein JW827_09725 [Spirochaetes bacterium]|nr:hypothetical protein [Spirochaetota bacterium]
MSYKETDYPLIFKTLKNLSELYQNPALIYKIVEEIYRNYKYIPLYPGILHDTVSRMVVRSSAGNIKEKDWISFESGQVKYSGRVKSIKKGIIYLENVTRVQFNKKMHIGQKRIKNIIRINEKQLKQDWPMLIYEEK